MRIPTYDRQIYTKAAPPIAPTPVFEAQRAALNSKRNVFGIRNNLNTIEKNEENRKTQAGFQTRSFELQHKNLNNQINYRSAQTTLQWVNLAVDLGYKAVGLYQSYMDTQTAKAIEIYNKEMRFHDREIERKNYTLGDVNDINSQYGELTATNFEAHDGALEKALDGIENQKIRSVVEDYAKENNRERMQKQWFKFQDAKQEQSRKDLIGCIDSAVLRSDYDAIDGYLRLGVQDGLFTPEVADKLDAAAEKNIINSQLQRGVNSIFENGGDAKNARDFIMQYEPRVSGRQNYVLTTEDKEAFYKKIADAKKIDDALQKERTQKVFTAETNRLMDRFIGGELTLSDVRNSRLPEAKADGFESQFSQKYFVDLLEKKASDGEKAFKSDPATMRELYMNMEDRQRTYNENYTAIYKALADEKVTTADFEKLMNQLDDDTTAGIVVKTGATTLADAFKDGMLDDSGYTAAVEEYWDTVKARNLDSGTIAQETKNLIVKYARKGKDAMQWLGVENERVGLFNSNKYDAEEYLESNRIENETDSLYARHLDEAKRLSREEYDTEIQKSAIAEYGRPLTDNELSEYKEAHSFYEYQQRQQDIGEQLENYDAPDEFKMANTDFDKGIVASILNKNNLDLDVKNIFKKITSDATSFLIQDARGKFYYSTKGILMAWDEGAGVWRYQ